MKPSFKKMLLYAPLFAMSAALPIGVSARDMEHIFLQEAGLENVRLYDPFLLNAEYRNISLLLQLEPMRFLAHFYTTARLPRPSVGTMVDPVTGELLSPSGAVPYDSLFLPGLESVSSHTWERTNDMTFRGHMFGHYMSALAMAYRASEDEELKTRLAARLLESVIELQRCQAASFTDPEINSGFIGPFSDAILDFYYINNHPLDGLNIGARHNMDGRIFVPWYNLHKIFAGLIDIYVHVQDVPLPEPITHQGEIFTDLGALALDIVSHFADYFYNYRVSEYTQENLRRLHAVEFGGMNDALYNLYSITGSHKHRAGAEAFDKTGLLDDIAAGRDVLPGLHANTQIPKFIGALNRYKTLTRMPNFPEGLTEEEIDLLETRYLASATNFFDIVLRSHTFITGGNSEWERFRTPEHMAATINAPTTHETCNVHNMLKLARGLFKLTGDIKYADYYENAFINGILSSINPETGEKMYFQPMGTGHFKHFGFINFWCCTGTGIESFVKLRDSIYFVNDGQVFVNMYFSSQLDSITGNLRLTQESNLYATHNDRPFSDTVKFTIGRVDETAQLGNVEIRFRIPDWTAGGRSNATLRINGNVVVNPIANGGYLVVQNPSDGDIIELTFPMEVAYGDMEANRNITAFRYGPLVLSTGMGREGLNLPLNQRTVGEGILVWASLRDGTAPSRILIEDGQTVEEWKANLASNLTRVENTPFNQPQFRLQGTNFDDDFLFTPHFLRHDERFGLYFTLADTEDTSVIQDMMLERKRAEREMEDVVASLTNFDNHANEGEFANERVGTVNGMWKGRTYRSSESFNTPDARMSFNMPVVPGAQNYLHTTLARADSGRSWEILINGQPWDIETVTNNISVGTPLDADFYVVTRAIPMEFTPDDGSLPQDDAGRPFVTIEFRRIGGWLGRLFGISVTLHSQRFDTIPNLRELSFEGGQLVPPFHPDVLEYTLVFEGETPENVAMTATPWKNSGIVTAGGIIIDDTRPKTIPVPQYLTVEAFAQNHLSSVVYTVRIGDAQKPDTCPRQAPRVWFKMDEEEGITIADITGNHEPGIIENGAAFTTIDGFRGLDLNGNNRHVVLPRTIFRDVPGDFTVSLMVYFRSGSAWSRIFDFGPSNGQNIMFLTADTLQLNMSNGSPLTPAVECNNRNNVNQWRHIAISHSGRVSTMYIDGRMVASGPQAVPANRAPAEGNFFLGRSNWPDSFPHIVLRDFRIYSRSMSALEIALIHGQANAAAALQLLEMPYALANGDTLPQTLAGFPVKWTSNHAGFLADDGITVAQAKDDVKLTATITGFEGLARDFTVALADDSYEEIIPSPAETAENIEATGAEDISTDDTGRPFTIPVIAGVLVALAAAAGYVMLRLKGRTAKQA